MPQKYRKKSRRRGRRRRLPETRAMVAARGGTVYAPPGFRQRAAATTIGNFGAYIADRAVNAAFQNWANTGHPGRSRTTSLHQTLARTRGEMAKAQNKQTNKFDGTRRHEELNPITSVKQSKQGKGFNNRPNGVVKTHYSSKIPKWKKDRLKRYKYDVFQTILLSRSNRLANSQNNLESARFPIKLPECRNDEEVQSVIFQPFISHFAGVHTSHYRYVNSGGTALIASTGTNGRLDTVQNKVDVGRYNLPAGIEGAVDAAEIVYAHTGVSANNARALANRNQINAYYDQLIKMTKIDLVFTASRAFPVKCSVSVVRFIKPSAPYTLTADDTKELCNNINGKGLDFDSYVTEWMTEFVMPALRVNKKPPTYSVNKQIDSNWMQTNSFQEDTVSEALTEAGETILGKNVRVRSTEIADGQVSSQYVIMIKYRKIREPQVFTYKQAIQQSYDNVVASVELPVLTEESMNIPQSSGANVGGQDGAPFISDQGDESKANLYCHGKIVTQVGFRSETETVPSVMSTNSAEAAYKKPLSLNISPWNYDTDADGIYTRSANHENTA